MEGTQAQRRARLLVLGAGPAQLGLLEAARRRDLFVIAVDRDPSAPGFHFADRRALISVEDEQAIEHLATADPVDGVVAPGIDWPVAIAARVAERLALSHPISAETALLATSKLRQRERFAAAGIPQPLHNVCRTLDETTTAAADLGYPCVLKPIDRQGQRGLTVVEEPGELAVAYERAVDESRAGVLLVEELVHGPEVTVNAFSINGRFHPLTVTDRLLAPPPAFGVALQHVWPSSLAPEDVGVAVEAAASAAAALGVKDGPTYTQIRIGRDGPRVGELAARLGGGHDAELCEAVLGVDLNGLVLQTSLGEPIDERAVLPVERAGGGCVRFLVAPAGELQDVDGVDDARAQDGIVDARIYRRAGHRFGGLRRGSDRAGAVIAVGATRAEAQARAAAAAECIRFDTVRVEALASHT